MEPEGDALDELAGKWSRHYGYGDIKISTSDPASPWTYRVELHYKDKSQYRFWAASIQTIHKRIRENRPVREAHD